MADVETVPQLQTAAPVSPVAWRAVLTLVGLVSAGLLSVSANYGYLSDELYFLAAGKYYLDWGYMDQQPLVPLLAAGLDAVAPGALPVLRLPALIATATGIVLTALTAREFGGDRRAQTLAAAAFALSPWLLLSGHWLTAASMEPIQWLTIMWLLVRWVRLQSHGLRHDYLLPVAGVVAAITMQTKFQVIVACTALLVGVAVAGPRSLLRVPSLWVGAAIVLVTSMPTLLWQATHGWPALQMTSVVAGESNRLLLVPLGLVYSGVVVGAVLCCFGLYQLIRSAHLRDYRFLGWAILGVVVFYVITCGRANYLASVYGPLFAAATVGLQRHRTPWSNWITWPAYSLSAVFAIAFLPIYPLPFLSQNPDFPNASRLYETGWPELAGTVAREYHELPRRTRERTAIVGETYHIAGALDVHGRALGLPRAYSPHRGYWFFGQPPESADVVLYVGTTSPLHAYFGHHHELATVRTDLGLVNLPQGVSVVRYDEPAQPWSRIWQEVRKP